MWDFFKIGFWYIIVLFFRYGDFYLSLHVLVTCSSKRNLTGYLAIYSHVFFIIILFFSYIFMHTLKNGILNLTLNDNIFR